jgi:hypothetical protein
MGVLRMDIDNVKLGWVVLYRLPDPSGITTLKSEHVLRNEESLGSEE